MDAKNARFGAEPKQSALQRLNQLEPFIALILAGHGALLLLVSGSSTPQWLLLGLMFLLGCSAFLPRKYSLPLMWVRAPGILVLAWLMMFFHKGASSYFFFWVVLFVVMYSYYLPRNYARFLPITSALSMILLGLLSPDTLFPAVLNKFLHLNIIGYLVFLLSAQAKQQLSSLSFATTELKKQEAFYRHHAYHDPLTGLPNRRFLLQALESELSLAKQKPEALVALMFIDIDDLKLINDRLGHMAGDALIQEVSKRIKESTRFETILARIGGDEFALLMTGPKQTQSINSVAIRIQEAFRPAWYWEGQKLKIGVSIGISFSTATSDVQSLLGQADSAMYTAKNTGKAKYVMFDASAMSLN